MEAYQQRVVDERRELTDRLDKLTAFLKTEMYKQLPGDEQMRLNNQAKVMNEYASILTERIDNFK